jgi:hypothetical protein
MATGEDLLCWECVNDDALRQWLREEGHVGVCTFCGKRRITCPLHQVAGKIDGVIREFYRPAAMRAHIVEDSDNPQYWQDGESASDIIQEIAGVEAEVADAVDADLSAAESRDVRDGDDPYPLEHIDAYAGEFMDTWFLFEERLKHEVRFFDDIGKRLLDDLFGDLPSLVGLRQLSRSIPAMSPRHYFVHEWPTAESTWRVSFGNRRAAWDRRRSSLQRRVG